MENVIKRKTALFFSDIVGYSSMVAKRESEALQLLKEHDTILQTEIEKYQGRIIKHIGDAIFAEFSTIEDAANASTNIQKELKHRNTVFGGKNQITIRIGLHYGQVVEKEGDLFGNDVNICSRIEGTALPGAIAMSQSVQENLNSGFYQNAYGAVKLKNIPIPISIYRLYCDKHEYEHERHEDLLHKVSQLGVNLVQAGEVFDENIQTVAILYPQNLGIPEDEFFCYSFLSQVISDLQTIDQIRTPQLIQIQKFKDSILPLSQLSIDLGVSNMVELSILNIEDKFQVNVQLTSMDSGEVFFSDSLSGQHNEIKTISATLIAKIADIFAIELPDEMKKLFQSNREINNDAYRKFLEAKYLSDYMSSGDDLSKSELLLNEAIALEDGFCEAIGALGMTQNLKGEYDDAEENMEIALEIAEDSENYPALSVLNNYMGIYYKGRKKYKKSIRYFENGIKLQRKLQNNHEEAKLLHNMAGCYSGLGENERALDILERSQNIYIKIEEMDALGNSYAEMGSAYKNMQQYDNSLNYFEKAKRIYKSEKMRFKVAMVLTSQSDIYNELEQFDNTMLVLDEAKLIAEEFDNEIMSGRIQMAYSPVHEYNGDMDTALESLENAIEHFQNMNRENMVLVCMINMVELNVKNGNIEKANSLFIRCEKLASRIKDQSLQTTLTKVREILS